MAILLRRGNSKDYDSSKMKAGETAVSIDTEQMYVSFEDGAAEEIALKRDLIASPGNTDNVIISALSAPLISTENGEGYGTCIVIHNDNACFVFDLGYDKVDSSGNGASRTLINYLNDNGISYVSSLFISHYHADHIRMAALEDIINNNINIGSIILPHKKIDWSKMNPDEQYADIRSNIISYAQEYEIPCVEPEQEGYSIENGNITVRCYNIDASPGTSTNPGLMYSYYFDWPFDSYYRYKLSGGETPAKDDVPENNYNNFSMVNVVEVAGQKIVIAGDIMEPAQKNMADILSNSDLLFVPHHGLDTMITNDLFKQMYPKYAVINSAYDRSEMLTKYASRAFASELLKNGCKVTTTYDSHRVTCRITDAGIDIIEHGVPASGNTTSCAIRPGTDLNDLPDGDYIVNYEWQTKNLLNKPEFSNATTKFRLNVETTSYNTLERSQTAYNIDTSRTPEIARRNMVGETLQSGVWHPWAVMGVEDIIDDGTVYIPSSGSGYSTVQFLDKNGERYCSIQGRQSDRKVSFFLYPNDNSGYYENYILPRPDSDLTENKFYDILTTKDGVQPSTVQTFSSGSTPADNTLYVLSVSSGLTISAKSASVCPLYGSHFILTFTATVAVKLDCLSITGDEITNAVSGDVWEVSILRGRAIVKKTG